MADFNIRSDSVDVEQIMKQIRARIMEKRGVDLHLAVYRDLRAEPASKVAHDINGAGDLFGRVCLEAALRGKTKHGDARTRPENLR